MIDYELIFKEEANLASAVTSDSIDLTQAEPDLGELGGKFVVCVTPKAAGTGTGTVTFKLQDSADNSTFADVVATSAIAGSDISDEFCFLVPLKHRRYVRVVTVVSGTLTGKAMISLKNEHQRKSWLFRKTVQIGD